MIKLLFFIDTGLCAGGAEKVLCNLVNSLDRSRFDVTVMTLWPEDPAPHLNPTVAYRSLYRRKTPMIHSLYRLEAALGIAVRRIRGSYDIAVAYLECGSTKVLSPFKRTVKKIAWVHSDLSGQPDLTAFVQKSRNWYSRYDHVVCVSENVRESFQKLYGDTPPATVLYNVNDESEILEKATAFLPEPDTRPTLLAVGRLTAEKGFDRLLRVCARLREEELPFRLQILGEGTLRPRLEELIEQLELTSHVSLLGFQSNPYPYMKAADIVVSSSHYEGFSTVVTEALILGKPIVTTDCSGMDELLDDNEYGLITENSEEGLYLGLKRMMTEPGLMEHYAARAEARGRDFRREALVQKTEEFFANLLEGTRSE